MLLILLPCGARISVFIYPLKVAVIQTYYDMGFNIFLRLFVKVSISLFLSLVSLSRSACLSLASSPRFFSRYSLSGQNMSTTEREQHHVVGSGDMAQQLLLLEGNENLL